MNPPPTDRLPGLALVGYRGTGKSTVGRLVAERLGLPFVDADRELESRLGRSIASIFAEQGEAAFRDEEARLLRELTQRPGLVLATGGGVILREANRQALRRFGFVAWLKADPETLTARLGGDPGGRPALTPLGLLEEVAALLKSRLPFYREVADVEIETASSTPEKISREVVAAYEHFRVGRASDA